MNPEEKAKAYDEMLQRVKELHESGNTFTKAQMEVICPELADSEDKRIIRLLRELGSLDAAKELYEEFNLSYTDVLYWLEKQRVEEKYDRMQPIYDDRESFESALEKAWKSYNESASRRVDSFEDNYIECVHAKGFREGYLYGIQQTPVLTDDDKKYIPFELDFLCNDVVAGRPISINRKGAVKIRAWLVDVKECLKKQKEQKPVERSLEDDHIIGFVYDLLNEIEWKDNWAMSKEECLRLLNNYRPHKPAEKQDYSGLNDLERAILRGFLAAGMDNFPGTVIKETAKECLAQMKPAEWSDTDNIGWDEAFACVTEAEKSAKNEEELQNAVTAEKWLKEIKFKYYVHPVKQEWDEFNRDCLKRAIWYVENPAPTVVKDTNLVLWLQSLPERFNLQPKKEWSEEDKAIVGCIACYLDGQFIPEGARKQCQEWFNRHRRDFLNSSSWKPSEEQMKALERTVRLANFGLEEDRRKALVSLYEQLKKL